MKALRNLLSGIVPLAVAAILGLPAGASALSFTWDLIDEFSGAQQPANSYTVTIADAGVDTVTITMSVSGTSTTEFVAGWYFNYTGNAAALTIQQTSVTGTLGATVIGKSNEAFKADGDGFFDILFDFPPPPGGTARLQAGESVTYTITGVVGLDATDFKTTSSGSAGGLFTAAHVQGIGAGGAGSGWVTIPEPSAVGVFSLGLLVAGGLIRRFRRQES